MKILLNLGCWGRKKDNFIICGGVSNDILDITKNSERNVTISEYLDSHFQMFDKPLYSNVHTAVWNIQDKFSIKGNPVFSTDIFSYIEDFCIIHANCGLYLRLRMKGDNK